MSHTKTNQTSDKIGVIASLSFINEKHAVPQQSSASKISKIIRHPNINNKPMEADYLRFYKFL